VTSKEQEQETTADAVVVYTTGLVHCSVCADRDLTPEEVVAAVNFREPSGTDHGWMLSDEPTFSGGEPNPTPCNQDSSRLHYLMVC
jgi:hypothetical protein